MTRKLTVFLAVLALALVFCLPGMAMAGPFFTTDSASSLPGDWLSTTITEDTNWGGSSHAMTGLSLYLISGDQFASPGFVNLSNSWGASATGFNANTNGPASGPFSFNVSFNDVGAIGASSMYYVAYGSGGNATAQEIATFGSGFLGYGEVDLTSCGGFAWTSLTLACDGFNPVPLPPSALLMGFGLVGLVGLGWKRRKFAA